MTNTLVKHLNLTCKFLFLFTVIGLNVNSFAQKSILKTNDIVNKTNKQKQKKIAFNGNDGPYIINDTLYRVNTKNSLFVSSVFNKDSILVQTDNKNNNEFHFSLESNYTIPKTTYELPKKMVVISDIEGNYEAFSSFLYSNKIIDENHNWIYGNGHLVLVGDFIDRGKNATQVLWLIYKLDHQAKKQNGLVHFILGNHEILNFHGDHRYNRGKYIKVAQEISQLKNKNEAIKHLYSDKSELGKWLATKNVIEKIGDYIFVHGGLSPEILDYKLSLKEINTIVRSSLYGIKNHEDKTIKFLYSQKGPFWYRGYVTKRYNYKKIEIEELEKVLDHYNAKKIVVGHTPVKKITTAYNRSVILTDVYHGNKKFSGKTKGLLIENTKEYVIDDTNNKVLLED